MGGEGLLIGLLLIHFDFCFHRFGGSYFAFVFVLFRKRKNKLWGRELERIWEEGIGGEKHDQNTLHENHFQVEKEHTKEIKVRRKTEK